MVWGGGWLLGDKKLKLRVWEKNEEKKGKGERERGEKGLKNASLRVKNSKMFASIFIRSFRSKVLPKSP